MEREARAGCWGRRGLRHVGWPTRDAERMGMQQRHGPRRTVNSLRLGMTIVALFSTAPRADLKASSIRRN